MKINHKTIKPFIVYEIYITVILRSLKVNWQSSIWKNERVSVHMF